MARKDSIMVSFMGCLLGDVKLSQLHKMQWQMSGTSDFKKHQPYDPKLMDGKKFQYSRFYIMGHRPSENLIDCEELDGA